MAYVIFLLYVIWNWTTTNKFTHRNVSERLCLLYYFVCYMYPLLFKGLLQTQKPCVTVYVYLRELLSVVSVASNWFILSGLQANIVHPVCNKFSFLLHVHVLQLNWIYFVDVIIFLKPLNEYEILINKMLPAIYLHYIACRHLH